MSTTIAAAEILVIGAFAAVWILAALFRLEWMHVSAQSFSAAKDWAAPLTIGMSIVAYQLGWMVNGCAYALVQWPYDKRFRRKHFEDKERPYDRVRATVYQTATEYLKSDLSLDQSVIRISRAGVLNFSLLGMSLLGSREIEWHWAALSFLAAIACLVLFLQRHGRFYRRIIAHFEMVEKSAPHESAPHLSTAGA